MESSRPKKTNLPGLEQEFDDVFRVGRFEGSYKYQSFENKPLQKIEKERNLDEDFFEINTLIAQRLEEDNIRNPGHEASQNPTLSHTTQPFFTEGPPNLNEGGLYSFKSYSDQIPASLDEEEYYQVPPGMTGFGGWNSYLNDPSLATDQVFAVPGLSDRSISDSGRRTTPLEIQKIFSAEPTEPSLGPEASKANEEIQNNPYAKLKSKKELLEEKKKKLQAQNQPPQKHVQVEEERRNKNDFNKKQDVHYVRKDRRDYHGGNTYNSPVKPRYNNKQKIFYEERHEVKRRPEEERVHSEIEKAEPKQTIQLEKSNSYATATEKLSDKKEKTPQHQIDSTDYDKTSKTKKKDAPPTETPKSDLRKKVEVEEPKPAKEKVNEKVVMPEKPKVVDQKDKSSDIASKPVVTPQVKEEETGSSEPKEVQTVQPQKSAENDFIFLEKKSKEFFEILTNCNRKEEC